MIVVFIFGLLLGSFFNMLIYRLPLGISLLNPIRSVCPKCNTQIKWYENIPLLSYIFLHGKCSNCHQNISYIYPLVEIITAILFSLVFIKLGLSGDYLIFLFLVSVLIVLSFIDLKHKAVPDYLLVIALIGSFFTDGFSYLYCLVFAGSAILIDFFVTFYIQNIKAKIYKDETLREQKALGEGDIPIFALIGGVLGLHLGIVAIFLAAIFAIIPSIINKIKNNDMELPFIPFLSIGFLTVYLGETNIISILEQLGL